MQLLRPSAQQIGRFRRLQFGDGVRAPMYRAVPTTQRSGAYHDPFYYYYYDPYYDFANYMMVDETTELVGIDGDNGRVYKKKYLWRSLELESSSRDRGSA